MGVNKVIFGDQTIMDITDSTVNPENVIENNVFYDRSGTRQVGTLGDATTENHGLMSAADKAKLDEFQDASNYITEHQDISGKADSADLAAVATSGSYTDLTDKPFIPSNVSDLTNDSGYITEHQDISGKANAADLATVATSGSYNDLSDKPFIPSAISDLTDDSGHYIKPVGGIPAEDLAETYLTQHQDISGKANSADLATVATSGSYNDLLNKPTIPVVPTDISAFNNDAGYLTQHQDISGKANSADLAAVATSGAYSDLSGVPTNVSSFTNDAGYLTQHQDISEKLDKSTIALNYEDLTFPVKKHTECFYNGELYFAKADIETSEAWTASHWKKQTLGDQITKDRQNIDLINSKKYEKPETGIPASDLEETYLTSYTETDPTVPSWAKAVNKPSYTASEVGAPTVSEMNTAIATAIGNVHQFGIKVVQELPTTNIKEHTVYFVPKTGETNDVYDEYIRVNDGWEMIGNTQIDLSNYATKSEIPTVPVQDVQVNGTSILSNGIADIPKAEKYTGSGNAVYGVVLPAEAYGTTIIDNILAIYSATESQVKAGTASRRPVAPNTVHAAAFYGLARAAGDTTQSQSDNAVGTYTTTARAAIQTMLDVPSTNDLPYIKGTGNYSAVLAGEYYGYTNKATGVYAVAQGVGTSAEGNWTHTEGMITVAKGSSSHAEGQKTLAVGSFTHAEGSYTLAIGDGAHIEGNGLGYTGAKITGAANATTYSVTGRNMDNELVGGYAVVGSVYKKIQSVDIENNTMTVESSFGNALNNEECSISIGYASGRNCHNEGVGTISNANSVHTEGLYNIPYEIFSNWTASTSYNVGDHVLRSGYGYECIEANSDSSWVASKWQYCEITSKNIFTIGNGKSNLERSNALTVDINGNGHFNGNIYIECNNDSSGGTKVLSAADYATDEDIQNIISGGAGA